ncbi:multi-component regulatory system-3, partial [Streptomyces nanshensis]
MTAPPGAAGSPGSGPASGSGDEPWLDDEAGRLVRPYTVSEGRTR